MKDECNPNHTRRQRSYELFERIERRRDERASEQIERSRAEIARLRSKRVKSRDADEVRFHALMPASHIASEEGTKEEAVWDAVFQCLIAGFFKRGRRLFLIDDKIKSLRAEGWPEVSLVMRSPHFKPPHGEAPQDIVITDHTLVPLILPLTWATVSTWKTLCDLRQITLPPSWAKAAERHAHFSARPCSDSSPHNDTEPHANVSKRHPKATKEQAAGILKSYDKRLVTTKNAQQLIADAGFFYPKNKSEELASEITGRTAGKPLRADQS